MKVLVAAAILMLSMLAPSARADQVSAIAAVRAQPKVINAQADNSGTIYAFVKADKAAWDQYAAYLCQVIKPHQARIFHIRIVDVTKANFSQNPNNWPRLGESACGR
ncbi:conserved exported hypothetical protein [Magnetospirillum sp. LM-5]|uniref:ZinT/AdcA family metal-binding protein n=1 Tax=Magnetospirillum sp. LM-5 TaxID=2681466 RepID=UPI001381F673|nr:ZinT/AdcA family metal-binding protein [Magnetospirillum sp. LM-5]CAA7611881.1 conserved exported hypothetical protein [Magnetospirillum sp. LM-5]